jgi:hypothetical protein
MIHKPDNSFTLVGVITHQGGALFTCRFLLLSHKGVFFFDMFPTENQITVFVLVA